LESAWFACHTSSQELLEIARRLKPIPVQSLLYCVRSKISINFVIAKIVLIADDSAAMRMSVRLLLEGRHKELVVREAVDGMDAVEKAKKSKPDLILLDLAMPRLNGAEAATVLKNDLPEPPRLYPAWSLDQG
jgi:hypothetical protein